VALVRYGCEMATTGVSIQPRGMGELSSKSKLNCFAFIRPSLRCIVTRELSIFAVHTMSGGRTLSLHPPGHGLPRVRAQQRYKRLAASSTVIMPSGLCTGLPRRIGEIFYAKRDRLDKSALVGTVKKRGLHENPRECFS
jgi:hypothetical protein